MEEIPTYEDAEREVILAEYSGKADSSKDNTSRIRETCSEDVAENVLILRVCVNQWRAVNGLRGRRKERGFIHRKTVDGRLQVWQLLCFY